MPEGFIWTPKGRIEYQENKLILPELPCDPGLYRLRFESGAIYIGEANNLQRRLGDYLVYYKSSAIENEFRLNKRLLDEHGASIEIMLHESFITKSARCLREHYEIKSARVSHGNVLNGGSIRDRIEFHESEIVRLRALLPLEDKPPVFDLDELMLEEAINDEAFNANADELARISARKLGLSEKFIATWIGENGNRSAQAAESDQNPGDKDHA